jgi:hypothetical protein
VNEQEQANQSFQVVLAGNRNIARMSRMYLLAGTGWSTWHKNEHQLRHQYQYWHAATGIMRVDRGVAG